MNTCLVRKVLFIFPNLLGSMSTKLRMSSLSMISSKLRFSRLMIRAESTYLSVILKRSLKASQVADKEGADVPAEASANLAVIVVVVPVVIVAGALVVRAWSRPRRWT